MNAQQNLVKKLRVLLETEVSEAEVMMSAKKFAEELQEMIEKVGRLQNEELPPVIDKMRETYGTDSSSAFQTEIYSAFQNVMDALYTAKGEVDDAVTNMAQTGKFNPRMDMAQPGQPGQPASADMGNMGAEPPADLGTEPGAELGDMEEPAPVSDKFGSAEQPSPVGRDMKMESIKKLERKIFEMKKMIAKHQKNRK